MTEEESLEVEHDELELQVDVLEEQPFVEGGSCPPLLSPMTEAQREIEHLEDHFTLPAQSSTLRFRNSTLRVYPNTNNTQFVMENTQDTNGKEKGTLMKQMKETSPGIVALRATYTLVALCFGGILFVFAIVFLLNLITDLTISLGSTSIAPPLSVGGAIGVFLALPGCVFGLASGLVICNSFIADTWNGSHLLKRYCFGNFSATIFDWSLFFCFLAFPIITMSCCLLARLDNWWEIGLLTWFVSVTCLYVLYAFTITHFEVAACWSLVLSLSEEDGETTADPPFWKTVRACILTIQTYTIAGYKDVRYFTTGSTLSMGQNSLNSDIPSRTFFEKNYFERTRWFARLTMLACCSGSKSPKFYRVLDEPRQVWTVDEAQGARSFQTRSTWSLEKVYCRARVTRMVSVVRGPEALSLAQIRSSLVCSFVGKFLGFILLIGFAVYLRLSAALIALLVILLLVFWIIPRGIMSLRIFNTVMRIRDCAQHLEAVPEGGNEDSSPKSDDENVAYNLDDDEEQDNDIAGNTGYSSRGLNDALYVVSETYRVTEPSHWYSWFGFALELGLFFLWPFISLLQLKNYYIALEFFGLMTFAFFRRFFNPAIALQEVGSIKASTRRKHAKQWRRQSRFSTILDEVTMNRSRYVWIVILLFLLLFLLVVCFLAIGEDTDTTKSSPNIHNTPAGQRLGLLTDFEYPPNAGLTYPTCVIGKNFLPGQDEARLIDYTFASLLAYKDTTIVQDEIDLWFGEGMATDEFELVNAYRIETGSATLPVSYKLFNITNGPLVVTIRGTQGAFDLLADAQLWSTAFFMQIVRFFMPLGHMWTPIFDDLVYAISGGLQSTTAKSVAFYRETTGFVEYLQQSGLEGGQGITITGHSLGGGLAIITGTQTKEPAITISGPNAMLSRKTFNPPLTMEDLNLYSLNVIPERDPVAHIDDVARLSQTIRCTAAQSSLFGCHRIERTLCEIMVACGTENRATICECTKDFGYPEPTQIGNRTFQEACG